MSSLEPVRRARWRRRILGAALSLGTAFAAWLLLEILYRRSQGIPLFGGTLYQEDLRVPDGVLAQRPWYRDFLARFQPSDDPILFYEPRPGYRGRFARDPDTGRADEIAINSQGFRDREFPLEKAPGSFRIVVLGDSIVWGHGLAVEETFAKQLERLLVERVNRGVEVLNFGVSGYSTRQEVELHRVKASRYHPDLVIVGYCLNDHEDSSVEGQAFRRLYYDVFSHSYVLERLEDAAKGVLSSRFGLSFPDPEKQFDLHEQFQLLQSLCGGARFVVLVFPELDDFRHYGRWHEHELVAGALRGLDCEILDLLQPFSRHEPETLRLNPRDSTHPGALGNRVAAEAALDLLVRAHLVPPESDGSAR